MTISDPRTRDNPAYFDEFFGGGANVCGETMTGGKTRQRFTLRLGGAVFDQNIERAKRMASQLKPGWFIYQLADRHRSGHLRFSGVKRSGFGRELSRSGD